MVMETMEQISRIKDLVREAYEGFGISLRPRYPHVLIRIIPKEGISQGGILLPDKQNKTVWEGQVLSVYTPFWKHRMGQVQCPDCSRVMEHQVIICPDVLPGDHILFQHFEGVPVPRYDGGKGDYRLLEESKILAVLEYAQDSVEEKLKKLVESGIAEDPNPVYSVEQSARIVSELLDRADVVFHATPKTRSGV